MWSVIDTASGAELLSTTEPTVKWKAHCQRRVLFVERPGEPRIEAIVTSPGARNCTKTTCDLVLVLHGGPGVRDRFRADAFVSELSASGYLVLNVNFRGSAGFGKAFESLDVGSWGTDIPGDVYAAVNRLSAEGYRVGKKISFGSSFGGYLSLLAATRDQEVDCAIAHSATPDLMSFINSRAKSTEGHTDLLARVGDPRNPEQLEQINRISPLSFADRGKVPILLVNGASDSIAPPQNVEGFANVRSRRAPLSTFTFDREGHDINEPSSRHIFFSVVAEFMQRCSNPQHNAPLPRPPLSVVHYSDGIGLIRND
jgi:dipeptidyl aminopeptidase/acylaminoacyl peptidase